MCVFDKKCGRDVNSHESLHPEIFTIYNSGLLEIEELTKILTTV